MTNPGSVTLYTLNMHVYNTYTQYNKYRKKIISFKLAYCITVSMFYSKCFLQISVSGTGTLYIKVYMIHNVSKLGKFGTTEELEHQLSSLKFAE